jgi:AcrR family transcriptional regulator
MLKCLKNEVKPSYHRLVAAVTSQWEERGARGMSARQIGLMANAPVSSIYHHFESLEQLFLVSQQECLAAAEAWCDQQLDQLFGFRHSPQSLGSYFAYVVDEWSHTQRPLAFAWRECQLLADRRTDFVALSLRWNELWRGFWRRAGEHFSLGAKTIVVERIFDNESLLHMMRWRRPVDRAALEETGRGLTAWLSGEPAPAAPWREFAHAQALLLRPATPAADDITVRVRRAAGHLIESTGVAGVTHRAVAEQAGLTLGAVSHKCRTKSALLEAAFEGVYGALTTQTVSATPAAATAGISTFANDVVRAIERAKRGSLSDELFVAVARDASLTAFGAQLRYLRGRTSRASLQALLGTRRQASILEGALFSSFLSSQLRHFVREAPEDVGEVVRDELGLLQSLLSVKTEPEGLSSSCPQQ